MKRLHIHVAVADLQESIGFYSTLFGSRPSVEKADYAKWLLEDPKVNFAISQRAGVTPGLDHLGIQVESDGDLATITGRLHAADAVTLQQEGTTCCYAKSNKTWVEDPQGVRWESFHTLGDATTYGISGSEAEAGVCRTPELPRAEADDGGCSSSRSSCCG